MHKLPNTKVLFEPDKSVGNCVPEHYVIPLPVATKEDKSRCLLGEDKKELAYMLVELPQKR